MTVAKCTPQLLSLLLQTTQETCSQPESVLGPVKEAFKVAEQSAYEYFSHFSEGLREDVNEVRKCWGNMTKYVERVSSSIALF